MERPDGSRTCIYDTQQLDAVIEEMARHASGLLAGRSPVAVIGILRRGAPLADRLTELMVRRFGMEPPLRLDLSVKRYADDLTLLYPETRLTENSSHGALDLKGYTLLVVDDVLYSGHSLLKVVDYLAQKGPAEIRVAMLVDRGATRLPVKADVLGLRLDVAPPDVVECNVPPYEPEFKIELLKLARRET
ncbi:phosphoribosyltransferase domain-containing protein [Zoogloea sp.]|uniref:phosphoribosyltransferase domain-containing protein n=1 Tax=Zoogloea sp. TaxID=49181 RepID=UPI00261A55B8|nr:phosphoribosyltransferase domain-containing protein [uncultured Zoogloea sp.]MCK6388646.1 phosphoribosyltransferase domain-containing protein [Zoogloea sp.]